MNKSKVIIRFLDGSVQTFESKLFDDDVRFSVRHEHGMAILTDKWGVEKHINHSLIASIETHPSR